MEDKLTNKMCSLNESLKTMQTAPMEYEMYVFIAIRIRDIALTGNTVMLRNNFNTAFMNSRINLDSNK